MYRAAILTDVHANLPALQAALADLRHWQHDALYHLDDAIGIGPFPAETLELLLAQPSLRCVMGNHDAYFVHGIPAAMSPGEADHQRWVHDQLAPDLRSTMATCPYLRIEEHSPLSMSFLHYGLAGDGRSFQPILADPTPTDVDGLFASVPGRLIWYGHHHPRADCTTNQGRYINPGALGCSHDGLARYARLTVDVDWGYRVELCAVPYDPSPLFTALAEREVPERDFIQRVLFGRTG